MKHSVDRSPASRGTAAATANCNGDMEQDPELYIRDKMRNLIMIMIVAATTVASGLECSWLNLEPVSAGSAGLEFAGVSGAPLCLLPHCGNDRFSPLDLCVYTYDCVAVGVRAIVCKVLYTAVEFGASTVMASGLRSDSILDSAPPAPPPLPAHRPSPPPPPPALPRTLTMSSCSGRDPCPVKRRHYYDARVGVSRVH